MTEEVEKLTKQVKDIALSGATKEDIAKIEKLISEGKSSDNESTKPTVSADDLEELKAYRENERQKYLKKLPKKVIEQFKLNEESLSEVKRISTLTEALKKKTVGQKTPEAGATVDKKAFGWNPVTQKNEYH